MVTNAHDALKPSIQPRRSLLAVLPGTRRVSSVKHVSVSRGQSSVRLLCSDDQVAPF